MSRSALPFLILLSLACLTAACTSRPAGQADINPGTGTSNASQQAPAPTLEVSSADQAESAPGQAIANPASVYCEQNGGRLDLRSDASGGQFGQCVFPDGSECEEWAFFRGECASGAVTDAAPDDRVQKDPPDAVPGVEAAGYLWKDYSSEAFGYTFQYPAVAVIGSSADPAASLTITGPLEDGSAWPSIMISHPADRDDFRPPEGADLETWLVEHNLIPAGAGDPAAEARLEDVTIAGAPAVHLRHDRSPQSFAHDRYYFAQRGQLYMIVIGHTDDKEDWDMYRYFLESFRFLP